MENKRLAKLLIYSGLGLMGALILTRVMNLRKTDEAVEVKKIDGVQLEDSKIPGKEKKTTLLDNMKREEDKKKMGLDNTEYVQLDFRKLERPLGQAREPAMQDQYPAKQAREPEMKARVRENKPFPAEKNAPEIKLPAENPAPALKDPFGTTKNDVAEHPAQSLAPKDYYAAQVYGDQKLMANTAMVIRNMEDMHYNEMLLPKNSLFYGIASFAGNRVIVQVNKVKTTAGEFPVKYSVMDNDRIEGLYYQAPVDEVLAGTTDNSNLNNNISNNPGYGAVINNVSRGAVNSAKQLVQKSRSLTLQEGYSIYLIPAKKH
jgi:hypothetical protein